MSEHSLSSPMRKCQQKYHSPSPSRADKGAVGDVGSKFHALSIQPVEIEGDSEPKQVDEGAEIKKTSEFSNPVYKKLSQINGEINRMHTKELQIKLTELHLHAVGGKDVLKKRLKSYYKRQKLAAANLRNGVKGTSFDYLVIIDFEATCVENSDPDTFVHEIIEFPGVLVDVKQKTIVGMFRKFCKPTINPVLSDFCKDLTGVNQSEVNNAEEFPVVLQQFEEWMHSFGLGLDHSFAIVTDGPWDIRRFLSRQLEISGLTFPKWARQWINLRKVFCNFYESPRYNLENMLLKLGLKFEGRPHCGLDDSKNIARIVINLLEDGCAIKCNEAIDGRARLPKSGRCLDTGDGLHRAVGMSVPLQKKCMPLSSGSHSTSTSKKVSTLEDLAGVETDEDVGDLLAYYRLQSA